MAKLPTVTSNIPRDLRTFVDRVREALDTGGPDAVITARQLVAAGVATYTGNVLGPAGVATYATPPRPQNVEAEGALANIMVTWDKPVYNGHAYAEIWAAAQTEEQEAANEVPTIGQAELVGMSPGAFFAHNVGAAADRWYWVRFVNFAGEAGPYQGTGGVAGATSLDPEYVLEVLTGAITQSQLYSELSTKVDRIDGKTRVFYQDTAPDGTDDFPLVVGDIWIDSSISYVDDYTEGSGDYSIRSNRMHRWDGDAWTDFMDFGFRDWFSAINTEKTERISDGEALASQITTAQAYAQGVNASLEQEVTTRVTETSALSEQLTTLNAAVTNDRATSVAQYNSAIRAVADEEEARVSDKTELIGIIDTNQSTALGKITEERDLRVDAVGALTTQVNTIQSTYVTQNALSGTVETLEGAIEDASTVEADARGVLAGRVTTTEATLTTQDGRIGNVEDGLDDVPASISAAVQVEQEARVTAEGEINAKYTVKLDAANHVAGFGIIGTGNYANPTYEFGVRADNFWVAPPTIVSATGPTTNRYPGMVWNDTSVTPNVTRYWSGTAWTTTPQNFPFVVRTSPTTINGESVPAGVYMQDAFIANGTITNAKIGDAAIDNAKIDNLDAGKITTGFLDATRIETGSLDAKLANIDAAVITTGTIDTARIADASITLAQIDVATITTLDAVTADMGTITAGKMESDDGLFVIDLDNKTISIET